MAGLALLVAPAAGAPNESPRCPTAYDLLTVEQAIQLPLFQEGIEAGLFTEADLRMGFTTFDKNANGLACFKGTPGHVLPHPYLIIDDQPRR
jgi:hypothetical protein